LGDNAEILHSMKADAALRLEKLIEEGISLNFL